MPTRKLDPYTLRYVARQLQRSRLRGLATCGSGEETGVMTTERYWAWYFGATAKALTKQPRKPTKTRKR
jgi:hypothetical protein